MVGAIELAPRLFISDFHHEHKKNKTRELDIFIHINESREIRYEYVKGLLEVVCNGFSASSIEHKLQVIDCLNNVLWNAMAQQPSELEFATTATLKMDDVEDSIKRLNL